MTNDQKYQESKKFFGANVQLESNRAIVALAPMDMSPRKGCIEKHEKDECVISEYPNDSQKNRNGRITQCRCRAMQTSSRDSGRVYKAELNNQVWSRYNGLHSYN